MIRRSPTADERRICVLPQHCENILLVFQLGEVNACLAQRPRQRPEIIVELRSVTVNDETYREPDPPKRYRPRLRLHDLLRE